MNRCLKVLVVDDDDQSQKMLGLILGHLGHETLFASNGSEAVQIVKSQELDLVFMDFQMPVMDGLDATRYIREWENGRMHLPIVGVTAAFDSKIKNCQKIGMDHIISKPFDISEFREVIEACIDQKLVAVAGSADIVEAQPEELPILDVGTALQRFAGDRENYFEILNDFSFSLPGRFQELLDDFTAGDWESLSDHAHNLKGLSANLGAMKLSSSALELEQQIIAERGDTAEGVLRRIGDSIFSLRSMVSELLEQSRSGRG